MSSLSLPRRRRHRHIVIAITMSPSPLPCHCRHHHIIVATTTSSTTPPTSATASTTTTVAITPCVNPFERGTAPVSSTIRVLTILCRHTFLSVPKSLAVASYMNLHLWYISLS